MYDGDIRRALRAAIQRAHFEDPATRIVDELGLRQGQVRVDVAVVNGFLTGYEIKSVNDTLRRLPKQVEIYNQVLDYATIVLAERHRADAAALIPSWWGIIVACREPNEEAVSLRIDRPARSNPRLCKRALAELLWHAEALELLRDKSQHRGLARKPRAEAWDRINEVCTLSEVREAVRKCLKERVDRQSVM